MNLVPKPDFGVADIIATFGDKVSEARITGDIELFRAAEASYQALAESSTLHAFRGVNSELPVLLRTATKWAYKNRLVRGSARGYYNRLRESSRHGLCPLCLVRPVSELDHYLPKSKFPELAIAPLNLVPICDECNGTKLEHVAAGSGDQLLQAYYDDFANRDWLQCEVQRTPGAPLLYRVVTRLEWSPNELARVNFHFDKLGLARLYADSAAVELSGCRSYLAKLLAAGGAPAVTSYLREMADSLSAEPTLSWKAAAYRAWAGDDWFCAGGLAVLA